MENKITVVFIHGFLSDKNFSILLTKPIEDLAEIKALDLPGHAGVPLGDIKDISGFVNNLSSFIKQNIVSKYIVCGYSFGGEIALEYHNNIFGDSNYLGCLAWASPVNGQLTLVSKTMHFVFKYFISANVFDFIKSRQTIQKLLLKVGLNIKNSNKHELITILDILCNYSFKVVETTKKAVFVFHKHDFIISDKNIKYIPKGIKIYVVNNLGHLPFQNCIKEVCNIIKNEFILNNSAKEVI
ncbi:hypothetical protein A3F07_04285 [candidate division WWE3 bacterium RIFCSPHIGHO2_12_FULL_38_15]|uniref:AB hydrolase-1 domain-containing protein n=1 Tax=candidate division WWE3 bacterium RIFCSPHIGHO2_02_FULL_38_14 TaxID=1802620 RepID=A0A1F4V7Z4_UNCKA|nr:MAG: hypothetical protein A3F07_04285 [candidate division WWE3 bacterium RIFCSPHIGHO2_12_FULL_38_15]OGC53325.1 MAG: hypothetical protein A3D91_02865 [candidate division WWE3 bacterium RIFCSPHIGHO2_02_FULL_38_14]OGC53863.1 MAG: hypothetical protein A3B64_00800 [candidate division WWE3 bacterium RIFCSPLOWO2_01_FULL_37_24]HLB51839.1 alpha/beta hydrolase [Patescibacteria group bacterium]